MSHLYPLAISAKAALETPEHAALTLAEAKRLAGATSLLGLETEWITLDKAEVEAARTSVEASVGNEFVQYYENADNSPVLAVTYWKLCDENAVEAVSEPEQAPVKTADPAPAPAPAEDHTEDHTDDLYFRSGRTKKRGTHKKFDPNQMDLFGGPKEN